MSYFFIKIKNRARSKNGLKLGLANMREPLKGFPRCVIFAIRRRLRPFFYVFMIFVARNRAKCVIFMS